MPNDRPSSTEEANIIAVWARSFLRIERPKCIFYILIRNLRDNIKTLSIREFPKDKQLDSRISRVRTRMRSAQQIGVEIGESALDCCDVLCESTIL